MHQTTQCIRLQLITPPLECITVAQHRMISRYRRSRVVSIETVGDPQDRSVSMDELWHYGQICRVQNVMRPYLEGLTA